MSHFTVMVFGDNPEMLLEPFDEGIEMDKYIVGEVSATEVDRFVNYYAEHNPTESHLSLTELYDLHGEDWNSNSWTFEDGNPVEYSTYNPKSKWDWYQVGGRWSGYFKMKTNATTGEVGERGVFGEAPEENTADVIMKGDIDVESMRDSKGDMAAKTYDVAAEIIKLHGDSYKPWDSFENKDEYRSQPLVKAFNEKSDIFGFMFNIEDYMTTRDEYISEARDSAISPFAFITIDGEWVESGSMGWWGMVSDENGGYMKAFSNYFDSLPNDTQVTLFDCHI